VVYRQNKNNTHYNLVQRTSVFGEKVIECAKSINITTISKPVVVQFVRSGTSVGANYMEADEAESKRDFIHKISIARKEAKETLYWIRMIRCILPYTETRLHSLHEECMQMVKIFSSIIKKTRGNNLGL